MKRIVDVTSNLSFIKYGVVIYVAADFDVDIIESGAKIPNDFFEISRVLSHMILAGPSLFATHSNRRDFCFAAGI